MPLSACVVKLADKNAPSVNGDITGAALNCSGASILPRGAPGGDAAIKYVGRFAFPDAFNPADVANQNVEFDWSGNNISVRSTGTSTVTVKLLIEGQIPQDQIFQFMVDKLAANPKRGTGAIEITVQKDAKGAPTNTPLTTYDVTFPDNGEHELTIWKNTEVQKGSIIFQGFDLHGGTLVPPTRRPRKIEVIGDSIICGYGILGLNATCPFEVSVRRAENQDGNLEDVAVPVTESQYLSFTSQVARALDADVTTICWSGKGVFLNYKENLKADPTGFLASAADSKTTVPQLWENRILGNDTTPLAYDFSKEKPEDLPQVVFVSLGTNDFSRDTLPPHPLPGEDPNLLPGDNIPDGDLDDPATFEKFYQTYLDFVVAIRSHRPDAAIIVGTPPMLTDQFPLENARTKMRQVLNRIVSDRAGQGDVKVYAMDLVEMGFRYGLGCDYHPNLAVHAVMTDQLVGAIRSKTCWN